MAALSSCFRCAPAVQTKQSRSKPSFRDIGKSTLIIAAGQARAGGVSRMSQRSAVYYGTEMTPTTVLLFSYGTLQEKNVQIATFGRELTGRRDALPGYTRGI